MRKLKLLLPIIISIIIIGLVGCTNDKTPTIKETMETVLNKADLVVLKGGDTKENITNDLILLDSIAGYDITWEFSVSDVISTDGKVTRPEETTRIILTAKITVEGEVIYRQFELFVQMANKTETEEEKTYNITYVLNGGTNHQDNPKKALEGDVINLENPTREGYNFNGWYDSDRYDSIVEDGFVIDQDITLYAAWIEEDIHSGGDDPIVPITDNPVVIENQNDPVVTSYYSSINLDKSASSLKSDLYSLINVREASYDYAKSYLLEADQDIDDPTKLRSIYDGVLWSKKWDPDNNWNREHVWPQSKLNGAGKGEAHNLRVCTNRTNSSRGNSAFGDGTGSYGRVGSYWWPGDQDKGDVARILMYMFVRHNLSVPSLSQIDVLLKWHIEDPVDAFEIQRNNVIHDAQGNRNPFIDHPEIFEKFWNLARGRTAFTIIENQKYASTVATYELNKTIYITPENKEYNI